MKSLLHSRKVILQGAFKNKLNDSGSKSQEELEVKEKRLVFNFTKLIRMCLDLRLLLDSHACHFICEIEICMSVYTVSVLFLSIVSPVYNSSVWLQLSYETNKVLGIELNSQFRHN